MKYNLFFLILIPLFFFSCKNKQDADLLIFNAKIYSVDSDFGIYDAMIIKDGKILDIGKVERLKSNFKFKEELDLKSKFVYPGFHDAHCHFYGYALIKKRYADLGSANSLEEVVRILKEYYKDNPDSEWILGRGWDQNKWGSTELPSNEILNENFPNKNVLLIRVDGHAVLANDKLLKSAAFDIDTEIDGGELLKKELKLSGLVLENAADSLKSMIPDMNAAEFEQAILAAQQDMYKVGLTSLTDAGLSKKVIDKLIKLNSEEKLKLRLDLMLNPDLETVNHFVKNKVNNDWIRVSSIKLYADGALGSRGACLLRPYNDDKNNYGIIVSRKEEMIKMAKIAYENEFQLNTHAIGDSAVRMVLDLYSSILKPKNDKRWRIEHAQIVNDKDLNKFQLYNIIPSINSTHATSDMSWAEDRLGSERINDAYRYKDLLGCNGYLPNGSDFPVEDINPIYGFFAAVFRKNHNFEPKDGFLANNSLSRIEALKSMTIWAAKASFKEDVQGSLEVGKYADFVVLDKDILEISEDNVLNSKILYNFIDGKKVYQN
jgi:predicted amidohydrolase YtcJ